MNSDNWFSDMIEDFSTKGEYVSGAKNKWDKFRRYYDAYKDEIDSAFKRSPYFSFNAYSFRWDTIFSPIEHFAWASMRCHGRIAMYPQYPVGKYFTDFANPNLKIILECDGKQWHKDFQKDYNRDVDLFNKGWLVFRVKGSEFYNDYKTWDDFYCESMSEFEIEYELGNWIMNTGDGVIYSIMNLFFFRNHDELLDTEINVCEHSFNMNLKSLMVDSLKEHCNMKEWTVEEHLLSLNL